MITMQVADEYVMNLPKTYPEFSQLHLGAFSTIN